MPEVLGKSNFIRFVGSIVAMGLTLATIFPAAATSQESLAKISQEESQAVSLLKNLQDDLEVARENQNALNSRLNAVTRALMSAYDELEATEEEIKTSQSRVDRRLSEVYVRRNHGFLAVLLNAEDFGDFWQRLYFLSSLNAADTRLLETLKREEKQRTSLVETVKERRRQQSLYFRVAHEKIAEIESLVQETETVRRRLSAQKKALFAELLTGSQGSYFPLAGGASFPGLQEAMVAPHTHPYLITDSMPQRYRSTTVTFGGQASWYGNEFHGMTTANGEVYNENEFTAASPSLPFNTYLGVSYQGRRIIVRINDRGPFAKGRILDLSKRAARALGFGVGQIHMEILEPVVAD